MDAWKNLSSTGYTVTDELYTNFGTTKKSLEKWPAFKVDGFAIYTDEAPHAGDPLIQDTDYVLEDIDANKSTEYGEDIYSKVRMINNSTGDIYISYTGIGSYVDMDVFQNMLTPYAPTALNISAGNQETDLSIYERGGASEKWNGFRIKVSVTGGLDAGTYNMLWTGTTYKIGGVALAANDRRLVGESYMILELDKTNGDWIIIEDGTEAVFISYSNSSTVNADTIIDFSTKEVDKYGSVTTGAAWVFTAPKAGLYDVSSAIVGNAAGTMRLYKNGAHYRYANRIEAGGQFGNSVWKLQLAKGNTLNVRFSAASSASAEAWVTITELKKAV